MITEEANNERTPVELGVSTLANQALEFLENRESKALKAVKEYFSLIAERIKLFDISRDEEITYDLVIKKADEMIPLRNEIIAVTINIAKYQENNEFYKELHSFFENLLPFFRFRNEGESDRTIGSDHYKLFGSELFIYIVAVLLKYGRFEQLNELTNQGYYIPDWRYNSVREFIPYCKFNQVPETLIEHFRRKVLSEERVKELFIKGRLYEPKFHYQELAQADFVLHFISLLDIRLNKERLDDIWHIGLNSESYHFELFVRSESAWFFEKFARCLRFVTKSELIEFNNAIKENRIEVYSYYPKYDWGRKISLEKIASRA